MFFHGHSSTEPAGLVLTAAEAVRQRAATQARIARAPEPTIRLFDRRIERRHCKFTPFGPYRLR